VDHVVIFRTVDGGRSWQKAAPIPVRFTVPTDVIWTGAGNHASWFSFVDPQNGWLLLGSGPAWPAGTDQTWTGATWRVGDLYRTSDGGLHWTLAASNPDSPCIPAALNGRLHESAMSLSSPSTGWMLTSCGLQATHDGGLTWRSSTTPLPVVEAPVFFDQQHGVVFAEGGGLLVTSNGGASWSVRAPPGSSWPIDLINANEGWAIDLGPSPLQCDSANLAACSNNFQLYRTSDGGKTWVKGSTTSLLLPAPKYWPPAYLHFVDSKTGFLDPGGPIEGFFRTSDGGRTWRAVNGTIQGP
jgi:photosystem II stability/assembly factor-like uncharacterized protein